MHGISIDAVARPGTVIHSGARGETALPDSYWRSLFYFNVYRLIVALLLLVTAVVFADSVFGSHSLTTFLYASAAYILLTVVFFATTTSRRPEFNVQVALQVGSDVLFITLLTYASGGSWTRRRSCAASAPNRAKPTAESKPPKASWAFTSSATARRIPTATASARPA